MPTYKRLLYRAIPNRYEQQALQSIKKPHILDILRKLRKSIIPKLRSNSKIDTYIFGFAFSKTVISCLKKMGWGLLEFEKLI